MIQAMAARPVGPNLLFSHTLHRFVGDQKANEAFQHADRFLTGTGSYSAITSKHRLDTWHHRGLLGKASTAVVQTVGAAIQGAVWLPVGAAACLYGCSLGMLNREHVRRVLTDYFVPALATLMAIDIAIQTISTVLFMRWARGMFTA